MKSNALLSALLSAGAADPAGVVPASQPFLTPHAVHPETALLGAGICALAVWIVRRATRPAKLRLGNTPGRPNSLTPLHVLAVYIPWIAAQQLLPHENFHAQLLGILVSEAFWLAVCLTVAKLTFRHGLARGLGLSLRHWVYDSLRGIVGYLVIVPACIGLYALTERLAPRSAEEVHLFLRQLPGEALAWKIVIVFCAVVVAPVAEEVFFRGLIQSMLRRYTRAPWLAILLTSAFFALQHPQWKDMPTLFALSVALGYNYERCGRLLPSILAHALFNGANIWLLFAQPP